MWFYLLCIVSGMVHAASGNIGDWLVESEWVCETLLITAQSRNIQISFAIHHSDVPESYQRFFQVCQNDYEKLSSMQCMNIANYWIASISDQCLTTVREEGYEMPTCRALECVESCVQAIRQKLHGAARKDDNA